MLPPWPWPHARGWVGNHSSYFWMSPWEVLQEGGREHPDLAHAVPEVPSLGWVEHTRAQGTAVMGMGRDVLQLSPSPSLLPVVGTLPVPVPLVAARPREASWWGGHRKMQGHRGMRGQEGMWEHRGMRGRGGMQGHRWMRKHRGMREHRGMQGHRGMRRLIQGYLGNSA